MWRICPPIYGRSSWLKEPRSERARLHGARKRQPRSERWAGDWWRCVARGHFRRRLLARKVLSVVSFQLHARAGSDPGLTRPAHAAASYRWAVGHHHPPPARGRIAEYLARPPDVRAYRARHEIALPRLARSRKVE